VHNLSIKKYLNLRMLWPIVLVGWAILLPSPAGLAEIGHEYRQGQWIAIDASDPSSPPSRVELIRRAVEGGRNSRAVKLAKQFLDSYPDDPNREQVLMLAGQAQMNRGLYYQAYEWFDRQANEFPAGEYFDRAMDRQYRIADAFLEGKKRVALGIFLLPAREEGIEILQRIVERSPGTAMAEWSLLRIADYHFCRKNYLESAEAYDNYLIMFRSSPQAPEAMLQAASATHRSFRDLPYDHSPLIEARQRYSEYTQQYPVRSRAENVPQIINSIDMTLAHKTYLTGEFYRRTSQPRAAAWYYLTVIRRYGDTVWAQRAGEAMELLPLEPLPPGTNSQVNRAMRDFASAEVFSKSNTSTGTEDNEGASP